MTQMITELTVIKRTNERSEQVLIWAKRVKAQKLQKLYLIKEKKTEFDMLKKLGKEESVRSNTKKYTRKKQKNCKLCETMHEPHRCVAYGRNWVMWGCANHYKRVCRSVSRKVTREVDRERHRAFHKLYQDMEEAVAPAKKLWHVKIKGLQLSLCKTRIIAKQRTKK